MDAIFTGTHDILAQLTMPLNSVDLLIQERARIDNVKNLLERIAKKNPLDLILVSGNSFDQIRGRLLETYDLDNIPGVNVIALSENGLVAQSRNSGVYWKNEPSADYKSAVSDMYRYANENFRGKFWLQGNMVRTTFKPIRGDKSFDSEFAPRIIKFAKEISIHEYNPNKRADGVGVVHYHPSSSLDIDPARVVNEYGIEEDFQGKKTAIEKISKIRKYGQGSLISVGRSRSDIPMFEAIYNKEGISFCPKRGNEFVPADYKNLKKLNVEILDTNSSGVLPTLLNSYLKGEK